MTVKTPGESPARAWSACQEALAKTFFMARPDSLKLGHEHGEIKFAGQGIIFAHASINYIPICVLANAFSVQRLFSMNARKSETERPARHGFTTRATSTSQDASCPNNRPGWKASKQAEMVHGTVYKHIFWRILILFSRKVNSEF
jgi:hypothetical protein